jgi:hypothetical protein
MRIEQLTVHQKRLSSAEAELWIFVRVEGMDETATLHASLVGPYCWGVETVQINYPVKQIKPEGYDENLWVGRVVIPEPNFWTPEQPFVYEGHVELWQNNRLVEIRNIRAAFKGRPEPLELQVNRDTEKKME